MEFNDYTSPANGERVAPDSLAAGLKQRIERFENYKDLPTEEIDLNTALHDPRWDIRCALLERSDLSLSLIQTALNDENTFVRAAAVRAIGHYKQEGNKCVNLLQLMLSDNEWLVRETALFIINNAAMSASSIALQSDLLDPNLEGHETVPGMQNFAEAKPPTSAKQQQPGSLNHLKEIFTKKTGHATLGAQKIRTLKIPFPGRKQAWNVRISLLVATMTLLVIVLTAAGFGLSWWNTAFGNPNIYQQIGVQQSSNGVTILITQAYADEGHTVIVYDITLADKTKTGVVGTYDLTGSFPQKQESLQTTGCNTAPNGVQHCYQLQPAFYVPAEVNQLTLTWTVTQVIVNPTGNSATGALISGTWSFKFSIPFHHTNNQQLLNPITGEEIK